MASYQCLLHHITLDYSLYNLKLNYTAALPLFSSAQKCNLSNMM